MSRFTSDKHEWFDKGGSGAPGVCITTYTMVAFSGKRSAESEKIMNVRGVGSWGGRGPWCGGLGAYVWRAGALGVSGWAF